MANARNYEEYRRQVLDDLGIEYVTEDITDFRRWRLKVLQGLADLITKADMSEHVAKWLDAHPEITTTVQDESLTHRKLVKGTLGYVTPEMYGAAGDGVTDDTSAIQSAFDSGFDTIVFSSEKTYLVSKANNPSLYPNHDEPCLYLNNKHNMTIQGNGAIIKVVKHGQGILEITESNNIKVQGLNFIGHGSFPSMASNGRAEKGDANGGYYNRAYDWEEHKNNSVDTSNYKGVNGDSTASWGTFGGGYIGNIGIGLLIEKGCSDIVIDNCSAQGFNFSGFSVGFKGHSDYEYNKNIVFDNCHVCNIYDNGFNLLLADGVTIENSFIENIGHPDARPIDEASAYSYTFADPGYGICCRLPLTSASRAKNIKVLNNIIEKCVRKGVDSHSVDGCMIKGNQISLCYVAGIEMAGGEEESTLSYNVLIDSNVLEYCGLLGNAINQYIYTGNANFDPDDYEINIVISNNILKECACASYGIINARIGKNTSIINNIISEVWSLCTLTDSVISAGQSERISQSIRIAGNNISLPNSKAPYPIHVRNLKNSNILNNIVNVNECAAVIYPEGALSNEVNIIGNSLYANTFVAQPNFKVVTGKIFGNTISGNKSGYKAICNKFTISNGAITLTDSMIYDWSVIIVTQQYDNTRPLNLIFTVQNRNNGSAFIYVRNPDGSIPSDGDIWLNVFLINNYWYS